MRCSGQLSLLFALTAFIAVDAGLLPIEQPFAITNSSHLGSRGNYFRLAFMQNVRRSMSFREPNVTILVSTTEPRPVSFTVETTALGTSTHTVTPGRSTRIDFPADSLHVSRGSQRDRSVKIKAEEGKTISVYGVNDEQRSTDGFAGLSCDGMDTGIRFERYEYAIVSGEIESSDGTLPGVSEFLIVTCHDDTRVQIVPSQIVTVSASDFGIPRFGTGISHTVGNWEVRRRDGTTQRPGAGETLLIVHSDDLTGTIIRSDRPIVVLSGHQCAQVPVGFTACDHLVEQIPPQFSWGYTFLLNPLAARESGDIYRVVTLYDDTQVSVTCSDEGSGGNVRTEALRTLGHSPGDNWLEYRTTPANQPPCDNPFIRRFCSLQSTNPVLVARYSQGYTADVLCTSRRYGDLGDPFMSIIPPVVQYINNYLIMAVTSVAGSFPTRFVSISVYETFFQPSEIMLDGSPIESDSSRWNRIYCSSDEVCGYGIYKGVGFGDHRVYHTNENAGLNVELYGFQQQNSYGFPAGMEMEQLSGPIIRCQELYEVPESQGQVNITCTRSLDLNSDTRIQLTSRDKTAIGSMDYTPIDVELRFRGGRRQETVATATVEIASDGVEEPTEEFLVDVVATRNSIVLTPLVTVRIVGIGGCPSLPPIENGVVTTTGGDAGDTATYSCNTDFQLVGEPTRTCLANGLWSSLPPICTQPVSITINIPDSRVQESDGTVVVELLLSRPAMEDIELNLILRSGSASAGSDFEDRVIPVVIPAGQTRVMVDVAIINDDLVEQSQEEFSVMLQLSNEGGGGGGHQGVMIGGTGEGTVQVVDDDIVIGFERTSYTVLEAAGLVRVAVVVLEGEEVFSSGMVDSVRLRLHTQSGSALGSADYESTTEDLEFSSAVTRQVVTIPILEDSVSESVEQFFARLTLVHSDADVQLVPDQAAIEIVDDDVEQVEVNLVVQTSSVSESDGQVTAVVSLSQPFSQNIEFTIDTIDGTATVNTDYVPERRFGRILAGTTETQVSFTIVNDNIEEVDAELFDLSLRLIDQPSGVTVGDSQGTVTITDDDSVVIGFERTGYTVEAFSGEALVEVVILSGQLSRTLAVTLLTADGTAVAPSDYAATTQVLTFGPGTTRLNLAIPIAEEDDIVESIEQFFARLVLTDSSTDVDVQLSPAETSVQIIDNDVVRIGFGQEFYSVDEATGSIGLSVAVLSGRLSSDVILSLETADSTARAFQDYTPESVLLTFSPTNTRLTVPISIIEDSTNEETEEFFARLLFEVAPTGRVELQLQQTTIQITDNDGVLIGFRVTQYSVDESTGEVVLSVEVLSGQLSQDVVVRLSTSQGTARASSDFQSDSELLTFNSATTSRQVVISITNDDINELQEQFSASLEIVGSGVGRAIQLVPDAATITINDDDDVRIGFDRAVYSVEEATGRVTLVARVLSGELSDSAVVRLTTRDDTAQAPVDYRPEGGRLLTFDATSTRQTVEISVTDDSVSEGTEQFVATLNFVGNVGNGVQLEPNEATVQITDDDRAVIGFEKLLYFVEESEEEVVVSVGVQSGSLSGEVVVQITTNSDTATARGDFNPVSQLLTFSPTNTRSSVSIRIRDDKITEVMEQFFASLSFGGNANIQFNPMTAVIMIDDDDSLTIGFDETLYSVDETAGEVRLGVSVLSGTLSSDVVVKVITMGRSARAPEDFLTVSRLLTFSGGVTRQEVPVTIVDDRDSESSEEFVANVTLVDTDLDIETTPGQTTVIISDNDAPEPIFEFSVYTVSENDRSVPLCIDINVRVPDSIRYTITATHKDPPQAEDADFRSSAVITVGPSSSRACIDFTGLVVDDDIALEGDQNFTIAVGSSTAMVTIIDDDVPEPVFERSVYSVSEGNRTVPLCVDVGVVVAQSATFTITALQKSPPQAEDADFGSSAVITVGPSSSRACIDFTGLVVDDAIALEGVQSFTLAVGSSTAMVTIIDDDVPEIQAPDVKVSESDGTAVICIKLGNQIENTFTVQYITSVMSARENEDFISIADSVVLNPGETESCFEITITDDSSPEPSETFSINFSFSLPPDTPAVPSISSMVTIIDNDVVIGFETTSYTVVEGVNTTVQLVLFREGNVDLPVVVNITTLPGTATGGLDYVTVTNMEVEFVTGATELSFDIPILDNDVLESTEAFTVILTSSQTNIIISDETLIATVTITDTDRVGVAFEPDTYMVTEGNQREIRVVVRGNYEVPVEVLLSTSGITATGDVDYTELAGVPVTFLAGGSPQATITITSLSDQLAEGDETLRATLTVSSNNVDTSRIDLLVPEATITITEEIDPELFFVSDSVTVSEGGVMAEVCLRLSVPLSSPLTVPLTIGSTGTSATAGLDYRVVETGVTFQIGTVESCVQIVIVDDSLALEGEETIVVSFTAPPGIQQGSPPSSTISIIDNDAFIISFTEEVYRYEEGDTTAEVCLFGEGELAQQASATLSSPSRGSATDGEDYLPADLGVVFSVGVANSQEVCYPLTLIDDDIAEREEYFSIEIVSVSQGATLGLPNVTNIVITDNDVVRVLFEEVRYSVVEGQEVEVCVVAEGRIDSPFTASIRTTDLTAQADVDYGRIDTVLEFGALSVGPTQRQCLTISTIPDSATEADETFRVAISGTSDSRAVIREPSSTVVEIEDNDVPVIFFTSESFSVSEDVGTTQVCLRLSSPLPSILTVPLSFNNPATAFAGLDYRVVETGVTFQIGTVESCVQIVIVDDSLALEGEETIVVSFTAPPGTQQGSPPSSTISIIDNDEFVVSFVEDYRYEEGEGDTVVCLEGRGQVAHPASISVSSLTSGTASDGQDYFSVMSQVVTFAPNFPSPQERCFPVIIFDDEITENEEFFFVVFESVPRGVVVGIRNSTIITITDNDVLTVSLEQTVYSVTEGESVQICALLSSVSASTVTAGLLTLDLSATVVEDYGDVSGLGFTFQPSITRDCVTISTVDDGVPEANERFSVRLLNPTSEVMVVVGTPGTASIVILDDDEPTTQPPPSRVVCGISSTLQVSPFSTSSAYVFGGVCDHWLVAPSLASSGLIFSIAVNFATDQPVTSINRATVRYGSLELVSTASGEFESNLPPLTRQDTPTGFTFSFDNNVVATTGGGANSIQLGDISVTITHTYSPAGSEGIQIEFGESSLLSLAQGLCGDVRGSLVIGGTANKVTDVSNAAQLEQFTRSWVLPARLQTSTVESCSAEEMNDTVIADPQFSVSTPGNASEALCYEFHGKHSHYFNLISDSCTSVNAYFTSMPIAAQGNGMTKVGIHAMQSEERLILGSDEAGSKCVDIRIEHLNCAAFLGEAPLPDSGKEGEVRYRKYMYKGKPQWRVNVPNCEAEDYTIKVTCLPELLRVDVNRKLHSISTSHGIMGQFWNIPLVVSTSASGQVFVDVNSPSAANHRHIPARKYSMTWDHHHKTCYYAGNSQGGPEASRDPEESVIEGVFTDYETRGLFDTGFKFKKFKDRVCGK